MRRSERCGCARNRSELAWLFKFASPNLGEVSQLVKSACAPGGARCGGCHRNIIMLLTFFGESSRHVVALAKFLLSSSVILVRMLQTSLGPFGKFSETLIGCEMHQLVKVLVDLLQKCGY